MVQRIKGTLPLPAMNTEYKSPVGVRDIETTTLPNGVRVISETMPHVRSV
jgi:predicted Zn-dependent peptidase